MYVVLYYIFTALTAICFCMGMFLSACDVLNNNGTNSVCFQGECFCVCL